MTAGRLRDALAGVNPDLPVVLSRDPEGNGFRTLAEVEEGRWNPDERELIHPDDVEDGDATVPCPDLRDLLSIYAGRDGYDPAWMEG